MTQLRGILGVKFSRRRWRTLVARSAGVLAVVALATPAIAQPAPETKQPKKGPRRGLVWDGNRPSIVFGEDINMDVRFKIQMDWRDFDPQIGVGDLEFPGPFDIETKRLGIKGELTRHFEYEVEHELARTEPFLGGVGLSSKVLWKDVFFKWRSLDEIQVTVGRVKVPFGLEQNTGKSSTDFAYRTLASSTIAPGRDRGVLASGRFFGRGITYELGVFEHDGDNGRLREPQFILEGTEVPQPGPSIAGRLTFAVLRAFNAPDWLDGLRVGVAYTTADLPDGLNSLRGQSVFGTANYFDRVYVKGRRQRIGSEFSWTPGPVGLKAEWMQAREDRENQGNRDQDLSDFLSTGWYASGTVLLTGENKADEIEPDRPLFQGGIGAIELGVRYDELGFGSARHEGQAFQNPRSDNLIGAKDKTWTFGVNWFTSKWVRIVVNAIHEELVDAVETPVNGISSYWAGLARLQIVF
ncbi:MAG: OprO/OprP family phosphate-selective porin [Vicinamibacterales bacterium]